MGGTALNLVHIIEAYMAESNREAGYGREQSLAAGLR